MTAPRTATKTSTEAADLFRALRKNTAAMLSFDIDNLTPLQGLKLDLVCNLRLETDRITAMQLRGEPCDMRALSSAAETLENLIKPSFNTADEQRRQDEIVTAELSDHVTRMMEARATEALPIFVRLAEAIADKSAGRVIATLLDLLAHNRVDHPVLIRCREAVADLTAPATSERQEVLPPSDDPPANNTKVTYIDADCCDIEPETPEQRIERVNGGHVTPRTERPVSPVTASFFENPPGGTGMDRFKPRPGW